MSKRQVIVLWAIALVLVGALVAVKSTSKQGFQSATDRSRGETLLEDFKPDEVAELTISRGEETVSLAKKDGAWTVANRDSYPANTSSINQLLRDVAEVKVTQGIEADPNSPALAPRFGMDPTAEDSAEMGTELVLTNDAGTELIKLTCGKNLEGASDPMNPYGSGSTGRFIRNHADSSGIYITSELFPTLNPDPKSWLNEDFLRIEKIESIIMSEPGKIDSVQWKLSRADEASEFELDGKKDNEILDPNTLTPLKSIFSYAQFEDVIPASEAADAWQPDAQQQATIKTFEGFTYTILVGPEKSETPKEGEPAPSTDQFLMTIKVEGEIPAERKKEEGDSEEQAKEKDEAFATRKTELEKNLATTKKLEGRTYKVGKFTVDALLKDRTGLIQSAPPATTPQAGPPGAFPGNGTGPMRRPIQAVTPPVAVPPRPTGK